GAGRATGVGVWPSRPEPHPREIGRRSVDVLARLVYAGGRGRPRSGCKRARLRQSAGGRGLVSRQRDTRLAAQVTLWEMNTADSRRATPAVITSQAPDVALAETPRVGTVEPPTPIRRNGPLLTLMLGHFTLDMYVGLLPILYPLLIGRFRLSYETVGLVSLAYSGVASISQPFFGWIAARYGTRYIGLALIWTASLFSFIGFIPSFPALLALAGVAGLGSGAYHPFGALSAKAVIPAQQRNTAMSVYVTGGTLGVALGP